MKKRIDDKENSIAGITDWTLMRSFLAVVREGSLSAAARRYDVSVPAVTKMVSALERELGVKLDEQQPGAGQPAQPAAKKRPPIEDIL